MYMTGCQVGRVHTSKILSWMRSACSSSWDRAESLRIELLLCAHMEHHTISPSDPLESSDSEIFETMMYWPRYTARCSCLLFVDDIHAGMHAYRIWFGGCTTVVREMGAGGAQPSGASLLLLAAARRATRFSAAARSAGSAPSSRPREATGIGAEALCMQQSHK